MTKRLRAIGHLLKTILIAPYRMYHGRYAVRVWDRSVSAAERGDLVGALDALQEASISTWEREIIPFDLLEGKLLLLTGDNIGAIERLEKFALLFDRRNREPNDVRNYLRTVARRLCETAYRRNGDFQAPISATDLGFDLAKVPSFYQKTFPLGRFSPQ